MGNSISVWFWFTVSQWVVTFGIFLCAHWPFLYSVCSFKHTKYKLINMVWSQDGSEVQRGKKIFRETYQNINSDYLWVMRLWLIFIFFFNPVYISQCPAMSMNHFYDLRLKEGRHDRALRLEFHLDIRLTTKALGSCVSWPTAWPWMSPGWVSFQWNPRDLREEGMHPRKNGRGYWWS